MAGVRYLLDTNILFEPVVSRWSLAADASPLPYSNVCSNTGSRGGGRIRGGMRRILGAFRGELWPYLVDYDFHRSGLSWLHRAHLSLQVAALRYGLPALGEAGAYGDLGEPG